jgi:hypothetical protein
MHAKYVEEEEEEDEEQRERAHGTDEGAEASCKVMKNGFQGFRAIDVS